MTRATLSPIYQHLKIVSFSSKMQRNTPKKGPSEKKVYLCIRYWYVQAFGNTRPFLQDFQCCELYNTPEIVTNIGMFEYLGPEVSISLKFLFFAHHGQLKHAPHNLQKCWSCLVNNQNSTDKLSSLLAHSFCKPDTVINY